MRRLWPAVAALSLLAAASCARKESNFDPDKVISIVQGQISVDPASPFLKHLETGAVGRPKTPSELLKVVGQIIALANSSDTLNGATPQWSELDPALTRSLGLHLEVDPSAVVGEAYGLVELPGEYASQIVRGDSVNISRYGLLKYETLGRVVSVRPAPEDDNWLRIVLQIPAGEEWYPGNNCEVAFPELRSHPIAIPTTALLHEGSQEFVLQQTAPGRYKALHIVILDTLGDEALVSGPLGPDTVIVSRGAILLKPYLHEILRARAADGALDDETGSDGGAL